METAVWSVTCGVSVVDGVGRDVGCVVGGLTVVNVGLGWGLCLGLGGGDFGWYW